MKKNNISKKVIILSVILSLFSFTAPSSAVAATAISLGTADSFAVLAGSAITDSSPATGLITGDVGLSPASGTFITGLTSAQVSGTIYAPDASGPDGASGNNPSLLTGAKTAVLSAYNNASGQTTTGAISADLGGQTLTPGAYNDNDAPDSLSITGTLTLDAQGDSDAVFILKTGSTLTTASSSSVVLINGAQACNVFWVVGSSATFGTNSTFKGNVMAVASITDNGGSTIEGRLLADANNDGTGAVTLNNTDVVKATCVVPPVVPSGSSQRPIIPPVYPLISVTKIPSPLNLPGGPGSVTDTYTVTNIGIVAVGSISVKDNKCSAVSFIDGDENNNSFLDLDESWTYQCSKTVSETQTNTVTACGSAINAVGGGTICDTANATVVVGVPVIPPLIHIIKKPNIFLLPAGGGAVTYSYTVTNPGTEPLHDVSVIDNKCTGLPGRVVGHPGDINKNNLLENNEAWSFTCQTNLTQTTTNIGTAEGHANGLTVIDFSPATVVVASPIFPDTGLSDASGFGQQVRTIAISLRQGNSGNNVTLLQQFLISQDRGSAAKALARHGTTTYFGFLTRAALAEFQASAGINPPLGNFGPVTRAYLASNY